MTKHQIGFLRFLTVSIFFGRAWQHLFWDIPLRELLWDEEIMARPIQWLLGMDWAAYSSSLTINSWIQSFIIGWGILYVCCGLAAIFITPQRKWLRHFLIIGSISLCLLASLYWLEKFMKIGQLLEFTIQIATPVFLYLVVIKNQKNLLFFIKIAIALTFLGHGLYALGYYPVPAHFVQMMIDGFRISESTAFLFLKIVGMLDLIIAMSLFVPFLEKGSLIYCIIWGTMTAFARLVAHFDLMIPMESLHLWAYEVVFRLAHGGLPFLAFWMIYKRKLFST